MKSDVFISHSSRDRRLAFALVHFLESAGIRCWVAPRDIPPGAEWGGAIPSAIKEAKTFLVVNSSDAYKSTYVLKEVNVAISANKIVIPLKVDKSEPSEAMRFYLDNLHWIDAFPNPERHFTKVLESVRRIIGAVGSPSEAVPMQGLAILRKWPLFLAFILIAGVVAVEIWRTAGRNPLSQAEPPVAVEGDSPKNIQTNVVRVAVTPPKKSLSAPAADVVVSAHPVRASGPLPDPMPTPTTPSQMPMTAPAPAIVSTRLAAPLSCPPASRTPKEIRDGVVDVVGMESLDVGALTPGECRVLALANGVEMEMVWCPPSVYSMSSLRRTASLSGFWMGRYEITQDQWIKVMGVRSSGVDACAADYAACNLSRDEARAFVKKLNAHNGTKGFGLPLDIEWEYACTAGGSDRPPRSPQSRNQPKIGLARNVWGLCDMCGGLAEWCEDPYPVEKLPLFSRGGYILRGGSYAERDNACTPYSRRREASHKKHRTFGARLVFRHSEYGP